MCILVDCSGSYFCGTIKQGYNKLEECINESRVCDGRVDCSNGIDEKECGMFSFYSPFNIDTSSRDHTKKVYNSDRRFFSVFNSLSSNL